MYFSFIRYNGVRREIVCSNERLNLGFHTEVKAEEGKQITDTFTVDRYLDYNGMYRYLLSSHSTVIDHEQAIIQSTADDIEAVIDNFNAITED